MVGAPELPLTLPGCPWCRNADITLLHPFAACPHPSKRVPAILLSSLVDPLVDRILSISLFCAFRDPVQLWGRIEAAGSVILDVMFANASEDDR